jgi:hypothetical protein
MTLPPFPAHLSRPLMNPVTVDFLARVSRVHPAEVPVGDLIELARMYQGGDLIHVDALAVAAEAHGFRLVPAPQIVRTAEAIFDDAAYARGRGGI